MHALNNLILFYNNCPSGDVYYSVAEILLNNVNDLFDGTVYDWADLCHVSTATISRFCQKLGYRNFNEFKLELSNSIENYYLLNQFAPINQIGQYGDEKQAYLAILKRNLENFYQTVDMKKLEEIAELIHEHPLIRIYTHGVSLNEINLQSNLIMSGLQAKSIDIPSFQLKDAATLPNTALVLLTLPNVPERTLGQEILRTLKEHNITTVIITNSQHSIYLQYADCAYCFEGVMTELDDFHFTLLLSLLAITYRQKFLPLLQ